MKKIFFSALILISVNLFSQATFSFSPQGINYQSVIRNSSGVALSSTTVNVQFKLYEGVAGPLVYSETHNTTTNDYGMVNLVIGKGGADLPFSTATFTAINWGKHISYEIYINGAPSPIEPRKQFMSVPYALFAPAPTLSLTTGNILYSGTLANSVLLPTGTTYTNGTGISLGSGTVITNTAPDQIVNISPGSNIGVISAYPSFTISSPPYLLSNATPSIIVLSNGTSSSSISIPVGPTYTGTPGNISITTGSINLVTTGVSAGSYGIGSAVPSYSVDAFGRLKTSSSFTPTISGDVINTISTSTVAGLRGRPILATVPLSNQVLGYNGSAWTPTTLPTAPTITAATFPNNNLTVSGGPAYTIGVPAYSFSTSTSGSTSNLTLFNGVNSFSGVLPSPGLSLSSGTLLSVGTSTVNLSNPTNGFWNVNGNSTTTVTSNFLGTTDNVGLAFRTNNIERMRILNTGNVAIGTTGGAVNQLNVVISPTSTNSNSAIYGSNSYSTPSSNSHGVYGLTANSSTASAGVYGLTTGSGSGVYGQSNSAGSSIFGYKSVLYGNAGRFEINFPSGGDDALYTKTNGTGYALHAVSSASLGAKAGLFDGDVVVNGKTLTDSIQITSPITPTIGNVLTARDNLGNAIWSGPIVFKANFAPTISMSVTNTSTITLGGLLAYSSTTLFNSSPAGFGGAILNPQMQFRAPQNGYYNLNASVNVTVSSNSGIIIEFYNQTTSTSIAKSFVNWPSGSAGALTTTLKLNTLAQLNLNDVIVIRASGLTTFTSAVTNNAGVLSFFEAQLVR